MSLYNTLFTNRTIFRIIIFIILLILNPYLKCITLILLFYCSLSILLFVLDFDIWFGRLNYILLFDWNGDRIYIFGSASASFGLFFDIFFIFSFIFFWSIYMLSRIILFLTWLFFRFFFSFLYFHFFLILTTTFILNL